MTSADVLANYLKVLSAHSLVAGQSFPGFVRVASFTRRGGHHITLKTDDRGEEHSRDPNWHSISPYRPPDHARLKDELPF
jgi:hypothetical protein